MTKFRIGDKVKFDLRVVDQRSIGRIIELGTGVIEKIHVGNEVYCTVNFSGETIGGINSKGLELIEEHEAKIEIPSQINKDKDIEQLLQRIVELENQSPPKDDFKQTMKIIAWVCGMVAIFCFVQLAGLLGAGAY